MGIEYNDPLKTVGNTMDYLRQQEADMGARRQAADTAASQKLPENPTDLPGQDGFSLPTGTPPAAVGANPNSPAAASNRSVALKQPQSLTDQSAAESARLTGIGRGPANVGVGYFPQPASPENSTISPGGRSGTQLTSAGRLAEMKRLNPAFTETQSPAETARLGSQPVLNSGSAAPDAGSFVQRVKQAESAGNPNAVGREIPGQGTAKGDMQVMDATNKAPGFGVAPARDDSPAERSRVGADYAAAMLKRYGNEPEAAAAYNWGPKNYDTWKASGADPSKLPAETKAYIAKVTGGATQTAQAPSPQQLAGQTTPGQQPGQPMQTAQGGGATIAPTGAYGADFDARANDLAVQQQTQNFQQAQYAAQHAASPAERNAALQSMQQAQTNVQQLHQQRYDGTIRMAVGAVAAGNVQPLGGLVQEYTRRTGTPVVIHQTADGQYGLFTPQGAPVTPPGTPSMMAQHLASVLSPGARQMMAQDAMAVRQAQIAEAGKIQLERLKGDQTLQNTIAQQFGAQALERIKQGEFTMTPDPVSGRLALWSKDGQNLGIINAPTLGGAQVGLTLQPVANPNKLAKS